MSRKRNKGRAASPTRKGWGWALASLAVLAMLMGGVAVVQMGGDEEIAPRLPRGGETNPVLSPQYFHGAARMAYANAQQYPEVMDAVYCYCQCDRPPFLHKSLKTCFATTHGAG